MNKVKRLWKGSEPQALNALSPPLKSRPVAGAWTVLEAVVEAATAVAAGAEAKGVATSPVSRAPSSEGRAESSRSHVDLIEGA